MLWARWFDGEKAADPILANRKVGTAPASDCRSLVAQNHRCSVRHRLRAGEGEGTMVCWPAFSPACVSDLLESLHSRVVARTAFLTGRNRRRYR